MSKTSKNVVKWVIVAAVVFGSIYSVVKDIDFLKLWSILRNANYLWVLLSLPIILLSHWIRAVRWKILLKPVLEAKSIWNLFSAVMVGYAVNNVVPRGGEFVRPFVYARRENVSKTAVFGTIIVERFLDVLFLLGLFAIVFFFGRNIISSAFPWLTDNNIIIFVVLPVLVILALILLSLYTRMGHLLLEWLVKPFFPKKAERIEEMFDSFLMGLGFIKNPADYLRTLSDSALLWLFYALPMYLMFYCFSFQETLNLGVIDAGLLLIVVGIGTTIAPTPGAIGIYHYLVTIAMVNLYNISNEDALAYAILVHSVNMIVQVVVGAGFFLSENIKEIPTKEDFENEKINNDLTNNVQTLDSQDEKADLINEIQNANENKLNNNDVNN